MSFSKGLAGLALALWGASPVAAWAWGVPGCTNLPEYNRALGALQGMTSACDMSVEEARRVIAAHDGVAAPPAIAQPQATPPRVAPQPRFRRHHRRVRPLRSPRPEGALRRSGHRFGARERADSRT